MNEFMPKQFKCEDLFSMTCYHNDGDVENEGNINKVAFKTSRSSTTNISFFDEDLLLRSLHIIDPSLSWATLARKELIAS